MLGLRTSDVRSICATISSECAEKGAREAETAPLPPLIGTSDSSRGATPESTALAVDVDFGASVIVPAPPNSYKRARKGGFSRTFIGRIACDTTLDNATRKAYLEATAEERMRKKAEKRRQRDEAASLRMLRELEIAEKKAARQRMREERARKRDEAKKVFFNQMASRIQKMVRGKLGRNEAYRRQVEASFSNAFITQVNFERERKRVERESATRVQCAARRYLTQKSFEAKRKVWREKRRVDSAQKVQGLYRERLHRKRVAATKVQAARRGQIARERARAERLEQMRRRKARKRNCATLIQRLVRRKSKKKAKADAHRLASISRKYRKRKVDDTPALKEEEHEEEEHTGYSEEEFEKE